MEYSGDAFHTFLDLDSVIYLAVNGTVTSLPVFIQNILNCVLKTNKVLQLWNDMGLSEKLTFLFWGGGVVLLILNNTININNNCKKDCTIRLAFADSLSDIVLYIKYLITCYL